MAAIPTHRFFVRLPAGHAPNGAPARNQLEGQVEELRGEVEGLREEVGEAGESGEVGELEQRIEGLEEEVESFGGIAEELCGEGSFIC